MKDKRIKLMNNGFLRNKKGFIYLFAAILLVGVVLVIVSSNNLNNDDELQVVHSRINTMNDFLKDLDVDVSRATYISGFRAFIAINEYISETGTYLSDYQSVFQQVFYNGSINGEQYDIMSNSTFELYLEKVRSEASLKGININLSLLNVSLYQRDPWGVYISLNISIFLNDSSKVANWNFTKNYDTRVSLNNIRDPVYSVNTQGRLLNIISKSPYKYNDFVDESTNDTSSLYNHTMNSYYRASTLAPSFIMRLRGNLTASPYGIESFVNLDDLNAQGFIVNNAYSPIDYLYFSNSTTTNYCPQSGSPLPTWFKLDSEHYNSALDNYEIDGLNATTC